MVGWKLTGDRQKKLRNGKAGKLKCQPDRGQSTITGIRQRDGISVIVPVGNPAILFLKGIYRKFSGKPVCH